MQATIPLDLVLDALREHRDPEVVRDTLPWRMGVLREVCRIVTHAHARGLAHPDLSTREIFVDGDDSVRVSGWLPTRGGDAIEADVRALGAVAHELLTLEPEPVGSRGSLVLKRNVASQSSRR
jgi:hypothetical protein